MDQLKLKQIIEGAILAAGRPLTIEQMSRLFGSNSPERIEIKEAVESIKEDCEQRGCELKEVASGYRFQVKKELAEWVGKLWDEKPPKYSRALLETLSLIAYRQPITRGDIEEIRGVSVSTNIMRSLMEREWVRIVGHRDVPGRPAMYATTKIFLDYFNLKSLDELPTLSEIRDLDKVNAELDLDDTPVVEAELDLGGAGLANQDQSTQTQGSQDEELQVQALVIAEGDDLVDDDAEDEIDEEDHDLDEVSSRVRDIEENIRSFIAPEIDDLEEDPDSDSDSD